MTKKINKLFISALLVFGLMVPALVLVPEVASAQDEGILGGLDQGARSVDEAGAERDASETVNNMIATVINIFSLVVGVISVIMIIIGGLKYITSGGDASNVTAAKNTILYAIIGLVIVALAQIIVRFVLQTITEPGGGGGAGL